MWREGLNSGSGHPAPAKPLTRPWGIALASDERGTKRTCPVTGKKFYDLNKDPVVSPYTGKSYPLSFFEAAMEKAAVKYAAKKVVEDDDDDTEEADIDLAAEAAGAEVISLDDADEDTGDDIPDVEDVEVDDDLGGDDDDTFLETDDEDDEIDFDVPVDEDER